MTYDEFKALRAARKVRAGIAPSVATSLIWRLPDRYRHAHRFWGIVWFLSFPASLAIAIFVKWWIGLTLLVVVPIAINKGIGKSAANFVLEHAEENEEFFNFLMALNLLIFEVTE